MFFWFKYHFNLLLISIFIILISCKLQEPLKTHGIIYLENRSNKLIVDTSNKNDVIKTMGQPHIKDASDGDHWIYVERILSKGKYHKLGRHVLKESNVLVLDFNKYGILNNKKFLTKNDMRKIKFSEQKTENKLSQKSFVEKFLQSIKTKMYGNRK